MVERAAVDQQYALMYYNHRNEEDMMQWRQEMDQQAMNNAELKAKLDALDQQVARLQGTPVDSAYVPEDAQDIALSPDVVDQLTMAAQK
jgi:cell division protein FtsB